MFAFGVWDALEKTLWLARDRFGEKPLYFASTADSFGFASEIRSLRKNPGLDTSVDVVALADVLKYGYVTGDKSILAGVRRLPPASIVAVGPDGSVGPVRRYWSAVEASREASTSKPFEQDELLELLERAVESRMVSDVPLGAFLSGGMDSSLVVALMSRIATGSVKTFTIGFGTKAYDESGFARRVAERLATDHHEWILNDSDVLGVVPKLPDIYDEPFADSSQIPTYLVSKMTRQHVTVALSGDGGDELFGGYERYKAIRDFERVG